ncbi:hypothetical protein SVAN01_01833 [Stagonosporopsis vannaccii]|nr:hypothetical protein SVAN01_01833 [Stagonosporopsis vannaccii]
MPPLTQLPTELRHHILLLALPSINRVESPAPIHHLSHINQLLRHDMRAIAPLWVPTHYISFPSSLTSRFPPTRGYNLTRICLDLFSSSFLGRIMWRFPVQNPSTYTHPELIAAWTAAVPFLSAQVKEVWLDVTPAPAEMRQVHAALDVFVGTEYAAMRFLQGHVGDVAALVTRIHEHYEGRVRVRLTGRLSTKSAFFINAVGGKIGRELEYTGSWASSDEARCPRLGEAVTQETLCPLVGEGRL